LSAKQVKKVEPNNLFKRLSQIAPNCVVKIIKKYHAILCGFAALFSKVWFGATFSKGWLSEYTSYTITDWKNKQCPTLLPTISYS